ncbi:MAG: glycosyltransferase [Desulfobacterales bacterium]|nr:glycosyltransferase [Desulfobacterales bacterium]
MKTDRSAAGPGHSGDDREPGGEWFRRLTQYEPLSGLQRGWTNRPPKVLHLLSQQPGRTGSGVALLELVRLGAQAGWRQRAVVGLPAGEPLPEVPPLQPDEVFAVRFDRSPVPFPVAGMSDIMPYRSTRFSTFTPEMTAGYLDAFAAALAAAARDFMPDLIQSNHLWVLTALARVRFPATPLCVYSHGTELRQLQNAPHLAPLVVPACSDADRVFALHAENRDRIVDAYGIPAERIRVVGAGFRADVFTPDPACPEPDRREELTVAYAGKISAPKGVPWLIDAFRRVKPPPGRRVRLRLAGAAGDGGLERIRCQAADMGNVEFLGALPQAELAAVLQAADVFVLPSFFEGLPLVVVESLACGCRVVMTDLPGVAAWMPAGFCADGRVERVPLPRLVGADTPVPEDLPEFVARLTAAIERQLAAALVCRRPSAPDDRLRPLSWSGVFERIASTYRELMVQPAGDPAR